VSADPDVKGLSLPELFHIGWVVRDCRAAEERMIRELGAGPFRAVGQVHFDHTLVRGTPLPVQLNISFGVLGKVIVELLEPLDDRSPHAEFLAEHGEGLHHLAYLVADFDRQLAGARAATPPMKLLIDGTGPGNPVRWVYLEAGAAPGAVIELLERSDAAEAAFGPVLELLDR
jgi:Glyoxalase/Bleomycin resistance protein/Dioxygenase superfamily